MSSELKKLTGFLSPASQTLPFGYYHISISGSIEFVKDDNGITYKVVFMGNATQDQLEKMGLGDIDCLIAFAKISEA